MENIKLPNNALLFLEHIYKNETIYDDDHILEKFYDDGNGIDYGLLLLKNEMIKNINEKQNPSDPYKWQITDLGKEYIRIKQKNNETVDKDNMIKMIKSRKKQSSKCSKKIDKILIKNVEHLSNEDVKNLRELTASLNQYVNELNAIRNILQWND